MAEIETETWSPVPFEPQGTSRELWAAFHAYRRERHAERAADEPLAFDEVVEENMKIESATWPSRRFYVEAKGRMVGFCALAGPKPDTPEYPSNRHLVYFSSGVIGPYRRRGIGTSMLRLALEELETRGARVLTGHSSEPDGQAFAEWCGAAAKQTERLSRLDFTTIDWDRVDRWVGALETRAPGTRLELFADRLPEEFLEEYCLARTELLNLMPWDDAEHGDIVVTPDDYREVYRRFDISRSDHHTYLTREPDGPISGITDVSWSPDHPDELEQWFTGVLPDYRGRGLGKALKAAMLRYVGQRYEGLRWVRTGNSTTNGAMLAINERLGWREYRRIVTYQVERDALAALLSARPGGEAAELQPRPP